MIDALDRTLVDAWTVHPRLGFAWALNKAGRDVVRVGDQHHRGGELRRLPGEGPGDDRISGRRARS
jgi:hypothetical protein